jgi:ParB-like chromosome segregation protein Spo0J
MYENITGGAVKAAMKEAGASSADLWMVPLNDIHVLPDFNVRTKNADYAEHIAQIGDSILANGYLRDKPLAGYVAREDGKDTIYLTDGHSRLEAVAYANARGAEIASLPIVTKPAGTQIADLTIGLVISNSGKPLTPIEKAAVCKRLIGYGMDEATIAKRLGFTKQYVSDLLLAIAAPQSIRTMVETGEVSAANAVTAIKTHGEKASGALTEKLAEAKASGKKKVTQASFKTKVSVVDLGVGWIAKNKPGPASMSLLTSMLSHVSGVDGAVIEKKLANACS